MCKNKPREEKKITCKEQEEKTLFSLAEPTDLLARLTCCGRPQPGKGLSENAFLPL